jgi:hypothetical protein
LATVESSEVPIILQLPRYGDEFPPEEWSL